MPLVYVGQVKRPRPGPRGTISPGKAFNHFGQIIAAFPGVLEQIVIETTQDLATVAAYLAPVIQNPRPGDPAPGNLQKSVRTRFYRRKGSDLIQTGRVEFPATDPRGHRYAKPLETGSIRRTKKGLRKVAARPFLVDAIVIERAEFLAKLGHLESLISAAIEGAGGGDAGTKAIFG